MDKKPYHCLECNTAFTDKGSLLTHIDDHAEHKPYPHGESSQMNMSVSQETEDKVMKILPSVEFAHCSHDEQKPVSDDDADSSVSDLEDPLKLDIKPEIPVPVEYIKEEVTVVKSELCHE